MFSCTTQLNVIECVCSECMNKVLNIFSFWLVIFRFDDSNDVGDNVEHNCKLSFNNRIFQWAWFSSSTLSLYFDTEVPFVSICAHHIYSMYAYRLRGSYQSIHIFVVLEAGKTGSQLSLNAFLPLWIPLSPQ